MRAIETLNLKRRGLFYAAGAALAAVNLAALSFADAGPRDTLRLAAIAGAMFHFVNIAAVGFPFYRRFAPAALVAAAIAELIFLAAVGTAPLLLPCALAFLTPAVAHALLGPKAAAAGVAGMAAAASLYYWKAVANTGAAGAGDADASSAAFILAAAAVASLMMLIAKTDRPTSRQGPGATSNRSRLSAADASKADAPAPSASASLGNLASAGALSPFMLDLIRCGVALVGSDGRVAAVNETAGRLAGLAIGADISDASVMRWRRNDGGALDPQDAPVAQALAGCQTRAAEFQIEGGDGVIRPICAVAAPVAGRPDQPPGAILFMRDDTQRIGQEHELRWRRDVLELILETVPVAVWITDRDNRILKINDSAARLFRLERHSAIGVDASEIFAKFRGPDARHSPADAPTGDELQPILEFQTEDDEKIYCRLARAEFKDPRTDAIYILSAATDITAVKCAKDRLAAANAELDQFARAVSHDLQEPLRKLIIFSEFLEKDLADGDMDCAAADLAAIRTSAIRMRKLVADLLVLARAQENEISLAAVEPARCIDAAIANISQSALAGPPNFIFENLPPVRADATLLTQIYQNLISNALKFSPPEAAPVIRFTADARGDDIILGVSDNGDGVPAEHRQRIFDPLVRLHRRDQVEGAGIGLAICEKAVKRLGGEIWVEPASPNGAHFRFSLASAGDRRQAA